MSETQKKFKDLLDRAIYLENDLLLVKQTESLSEYLTNYLQLPENKILSKRRSTVTSLCRQVIYYSLRSVGYSYPRIAWALNKDHSTIIYGVKRIENLILTNPQLKSIVEDTKQYHKTVLDDLINKKVDDAFCGNPET